MRPTETTTPSCGERTAPVHTAEELLGGDGTARIVLRDQTYILRLTRAGKLILTK